MLHRGELSTFALYWKHKYTRLSLNRQSAYGCVDIRPRVAYTILVHPDSSVNFLRPYAACSRLSQLRCGLLERRTQQADYFVNYIVFLYTHRQCRRKLWAPPPNYNNWPSIFWRPFFVITLLNRHTAFPSSFTHVVFIFMGPLRSASLILPLRQPIRPFTTNMAISEPLFTPR